MLHVWLVITLELSTKKHSNSLVLLNCFNCIFRHSKLELLTQFPASNDEKYRYFSKIYIF